MSDLMIVWDVRRGYGDWAMSNGALEIGSDLANAVYVSLFTDKQATPDMKLDDPDRRGWWGDSYGDPGDGQIGSYLWTLERRKYSMTLLPEAKGMCASALQWLIDDGIVARWNIDASWHNGKLLTLRIVGIKPDGSSENFSAQLAWAALGV